MAYKFSPSTGTFFPDEIAYIAMPVDCIDASDEDFAAAMDRGPADKLAVEAGAVVVVPYTGPTVAEAKSTQIALLNSAFQAAIGAPVSFTNASGVTARFPQTTTAKTYLAQCIEGGASAWSLNLWLDVDNTPVTPFTYADLQGLAAAMETAEEPEYADLLAKTAAVLAAETVAAVQAITF